MINHQKVCFKPFFLTGQSKNTATFHYDKHLDDIQASFIEMITAVALGWKCWPLRNYRKYFFHSLGIVVTTTTEKFLLKFCLKRNFKAFWIFWLVRFVFVSFFHRNWRNYILVFKNCTIKLVAFKKRKSFFRVERKVQTAQLFVDLSSDCYLL